MPTLQMRSGWKDVDTITKRLVENNLYALNGNNFCSNLSFFELMFPFGHFAKVKGQINEDGSVKITVQPIIIRIVQLTILVCYSLTLSAITLYDRKDWPVLAILALHFAIICSVLFILRIMYVSDAKYKYFQIRKTLRLIQY